jgi:hypothetical protein
LRVFSRGLTINDITAVLAFAVFTAVLLIALVSFFIWAL